MTTPRAEDNSDMLGQLLELFGVDTQTPDSDDIDVAARMEELERSISNSDERQSAILARLRKRFARASVGRSQVLQDRVLPLLERCLEKDTSPRALLVNVERPELEERIRRALSSASSSLRLALPDDLAARRAATFVIDPESSPVTGRWIEAENPETVDVERIVDSSFEHLGEFDRESTSILTRGFFESLEEGVCPLPGFPLDLDAGSGQLRWEARDRSNETGTPAEATGADAARPSTPDAWWPSDSLVEETAALGQLCAKSLAFAGLAAIVEGAHVTGVRWAGPAEGTRPDSRAIERLVNNLSSTTQLPRQTVLKALTCVAMKNTVVCSRSEERLGRSLYLLNEFIRDI